MSKNQLLVGCDPEFFVRQVEGDIVSAYGMIPGTKAEPHSAGSGAVQVDGVALEFNTKPAATAEEFEHNVVEMLDRLESMLPPQHVLDRTTSKHTFTQDYLLNLPEQARELGCQPDFNAYTGLENPSPDEDTVIRTTAGHVHLGWAKGLEITDPVHFNSCMVISKELDIMLGAPSVLLDEAGAARRELYGSAGAFRPKPYGVEYRVLSNFWVDKPEYRSWVFNQCRRAYDGLMGSDIGPGMNQITPKTAADCILYSDKQTAQQIVEALGIDMP